MHSDYRTVTIPASDAHEGYFSRSITTRWRCRVCGNERGEPVKGLSYDGSRRLKVDTWQNACGHIESYADVRKDWHSSVVRLSKCMDTMKYNDENTRTIRVGAGERSTALKDLEMVGYVVLYDEPTHVGDSGTVDITFADATLDEV